MDQLQTRLDALEQQMHTLTRRLRWWRGLAGGLLALAVLTWALPAGNARDNAGGWHGLEDRVAALEQKLQHLTSVTDAEGRPEVVITGANLRLVNVLGVTNCIDAQGFPIPACPNGLGNLIVGYNEPRNDLFGEGPTIRTGSHNVVVGARHNFSRFGGLVVGLLNEISGDFAVVSGGDRSLASGVSATVSGGRGNTASGNFAVVSGGTANVASGDLASITAGSNNAASEALASITGGFLNTASGLHATVSGGRNRTAAGEFDWVAGSLVEDE
jgi:hypothetical protein